jgi:hypothetical protein
MNILASYGTSSRLFVLGDGGNEAARPHRWELTHVAWGTERVYACGGMVSVLRGILGSARVGQSTAVFSIRFGYDLGSSRGEDALRVAAAPTTVERLKPLEKGEAATGLVAFTPTDPIAPSMNRSTAESTKPKRKTGSCLTTSGYILLVGGLLLFILIMVVAILDPEGVKYSLGMIALRTLLCNLPLFLIGGVLLLLGRRKQKQLAGSAIGDMQAHFQHGLDLFNQGKPREAILILEVVAENDPTFAPTQFTLGAAYSKVAGEYGDDEESVRVWANKSAEAFRKAIDLARRYGGLNDKQLAMAQDAASMLESAEGAYQTRKGAPSLPEDQRKRIYAEFMQAKDSAFLQGIDMQDLEAASKRGDLAHMAQSLNFQGTKSEDAVVAKMAEKHKITREQLLAIEREGDAKKWPFKGVKRS